MSVAWATLEWLTRRVGARTLFATHYHELTRLEGKLPLLANAHLAVEGGRSAQVRFLYQLREGAANESFGIQVAQLAGLPAAVIERAWQVLAELESAAPEASARTAERLEEKTQNSAASPASDPESVPPLAAELALTPEAQPEQLSLFGLEDPAARDRGRSARTDGVLRETPGRPGLRVLLRELEKADINRMTPLQALQLVAKLQELAQAPDGAPGAGSVFF
jgi:DNA mismatch repair protein MutS